LRRIAVVVATLGLVLALPGAAGAQQERTEGRPVSGTIQDVDASSRTIEIGGETYHVPSSVYDVSRLRPGQSIIVHWILRGSRMEVTQIETRAAEG